MARLNKVLVVGGGTAGWLVACYLAKAMRATEPSGVQVHLVESDRIGLLGVGEATFPSIRGTLAAIGLDERRFLAGAHATYKQGIHYRHWVRAPDTPGPASFFHPFSLPSQRPGGPELLPYWLLGAAPAGMPFAQAATMQSRLVEHGPLAGGALVEVHDLGWSPAQAAAWRTRPPGDVVVRAVGPFHTAPGGYPTGRSWAPADAVRPVADVPDARAAVAQVARQGFDAIKVTLHAAMPLLPDAVLRALVEAAHEAGLPALVHAEGPGQAARAIDAGADVLVHAPWTERLPEDVLARAVGTTWISTLAIHDEPGRAVAIDNIRRFRELGGRVVYGTDLGNGPAPVGPHPTEIRLLERAGLAGVDLLEAVLGPLDAATPERTLVAPLPVPQTADELVAWLASATRLTTRETP